MRLADFIPQNLETIVAEWEAFAETLFPASQQMTALALRDHVKEILGAVATDMRAAQSSKAQTVKSQGRKTRLLGASETAAQTHAVLRGRSGLNINQLIAEYRALRASVLRLWEESGEIDSDGTQEMIRFNEAIDQAVAESVEIFTVKVDQARNLLLGALGHDMRNPLHAICITASLLERAKTGVEISAAAQCLARSGASIQALVDDLADFSSANLGLGIPVDPSACDLDPLFAEEVAQVRVAHPSARIELAAEEDVSGHWDGQRLQQVLRNLLTNAISYGQLGAPIQVRVTGTTGTVAFSVTNCGPEIPPTSLEQLFEPLKRGVFEDREGSRGHLGIGLYIVREIVRAHGGLVTVKSNASQTVFSVRLPRELRRAR